MYTYGRRGDLRLSPYRMFRSEIPNRHSRAVVIEIPSYPKPAQSASVWDHRLSASQGLHLLSQYKLDAALRRNFRACDAVNSDVSFAVNLGTNLHFVEHKPADILW